MSSAESPPSLKAVCQRMSSRKRIDTGKKAMSYSRWGRALAARWKTFWGYRISQEMNAEVWDYIHACSTCKNLREMVECFIRSPKTTGRKVCGPLPSDGDGRPVPAEINRCDSPGKNRVPFSKLPKYCFLSRSAALINGYLSYPVGEESKLGLVRIGFSGHRDPASIDGVEIDLDSMCELRICISHANSKIKIGKGAWGRWVFHLFRDATVEIGDGVTCNKADVIIDDGELKIGDDCMFADIFIHAGDNHALFDVQTGEVLNLRRAKVDIGPHVWIASRATVLADSSIGAGSVIAANAMVKGDVPCCTLVAGFPARAIKSGLSWTRSPTGEGWQAVVQQLSGHGEGGGWQGIGS